MRSAGSVAITIITFFILYSPLSFAYLKPSFKLPHRQIKTLQTYKSSVAIVASNLKSSNSFSLKNVKPAVASLLSYLLSPVISGGILAGALHAVTGPDHLAAIFPSTIGKNYLVGMRLGASWGLGHGLSATLLGVGGFLLKGRISSKVASLERMSAITESAVGVSLLLIGMLGIKENLLPDHHHHHGEDKEEALKEKGKKSMKALFVNGFIHGFSWDGAPSLAPALAMNSWHAAISFLMAYCLGTTLIMSATAAFVGESTKRLGQVVQSENLTRNLSIGSSVVAILVGLYWIWSVIFG